MSDKPFAIIRAETVIGLCARLIGVCAIVFAATTIASNGHDYDRAPAVVHALGGGATAAGTVVAIGWLFALFIGGGWIRDITGHPVSYLGAAFRLMVHLAWLATYATLIEVCWSPWATAFAENAERAGTMLGALVATLFYLRAMFAGGAESCVAMAAPLVVGRPMMILRAPVSQPSSDQAPGHLNIHRKDPT